MWPQWASRACRQRRTQLIETAERRSPWPSTALERPRDAAEHVATSATTSKSVARSVYRH
eukprot:scaffold2295_cov354-Prasinococcus_capsulatus_cf.AAC.5